MNSFVPCSLDDPEHRLFIRTEASALAVRSSVIRTPAAYKRTAGVFLVKRTASIADFLVSTSC